MQPERKGKYALAGPTAGGFDWWMNNDLEKMYAVVIVQADNSHCGILPLWVGL